MANLRSWVVPTRSFLVRFCVLILVLELNVPALADDGSNVGGGGGGAASQLCKTDLSFLPPPYGNLSNVVCKPIWNTFVLRVSLMVLLNHVSISS